MTPPRKRRAIILFGAIGLAGLVGAAFLLAPNQITEAHPGTCVSRYLGGKYLMVDSCDSMFATYAVITSNPVPESMNDSADWEERYCEERVDGWSTYSVAEADGEDHIVCLGRANH
ncbi:hypothetical protein K3N28_00625 [Glycomyces sp. TRM65418]|uniref:hypothetical protein n=1 Tax=Glycomyces sp. TRM65418 TaxID=2867006 RepID=UPI001CE4E04C|nr:hypothetical protein [Glycomyces sp. TRM65418]MCC3761579.1 hypothetical protein [Glycomyces sp. TRM65418]QZD55674.1 hypothetical protein K3N28_00615 [Glycomyces sp. TRM65418]